MATPIGPAQSIISSVAGDAGMRKTQSTAPVALFSQTSSEIIKDTTSELTVFGSGEGSLTIPANSLRVGDIIASFIAGEVDDSANPSITINLKLNGATIASTGSETLGTTGTGIHFGIESALIIRTIGPSGTAIAEGSFVTGTASGDHFGISNAPPGQFSIDTTIAQTVDITVTWGIASESNAFTAQKAYVELIRAPL